MVAADMFFCMHCAYGCCMYMHGFVGVCVWVCFIVLGLLIGFKENMRDTFT